MIGGRDVLWDSGLASILTLARRDLAALLATPLAYVAVALLIVPVSVFGYLQQVDSGQPLTMAGVFTWLVPAAAFLTPLLTTRLLAHERRTGTLELLLASPLRLWELVVGKWLASFVALLAAVAFTVVYVVLITVYQHPAMVDYGTILAGYLGVVLVTATWAAVGVLASSLTRNRVAAVAVGLALLLLLQFALGAVAGGLGSPLSDVLGYVSASDRFRSFSNGQVAVRDVVYFVTLTIGVLLLATRVAAWRWTR